ncbi:MAG: flagellar biosynthetic protein FliO [Opitutaceae bacterium]|jgi:flagellar protein FliO/FliZ
MSRFNRSTVTSRLIGIAALGFFLSSGLLWGAAAAPRSADTVIFPQPVEPGPVRPASTPSTAYVVFVVLCLGGGAWLWFRAKGKGGSLKSAGSEISIDETRPLGNRQYLVLTSCRGRSFLIGVSQGRIDVISEVPSSETAP